jgi:hypothetical protein
MYGEIIGRKMKRVGEVVLKKEVVELTYYFDLNSRK